MMAKHAVGTLPGIAQGGAGRARGDEVIREALGEHVFEWFLEAKRDEWDEYRKRVSPWELERYLSTY